MIYHRIERYVKTTTKKEVRDEETGGMVMKDVEIVTIRKIPVGLSRTKAIREKCLQCSCGQPGEILHCFITGCSLHPFRMASRAGEEDRENRTVSRSKAIREKCLDCAEGHKEIRECSCTGCALWPFRIAGKTKTTEDQESLEVLAKKCRRKRKVTPEQHKELVERGKKLAAMRQKEEVSA